MQFLVLAPDKVGYNRKNIFILKTDNWDDYHYKTTFNAVYFDREGVMTDLGTIKIAKENMNINEQTCNYIPKSFTKLPSDFYSLWQSADNYKAVKDLEDLLGENIFESLNDLAHDKNILKKHSDEDVLKTSLFRGISRFMCERQFHRITKGENKLTKYIFHYKKDNNLNLEFEVSPESLPPTNIHVIIGRNGVGKTTIIKDMIESIISRKEGKTNFSYEDNWDLLSKEDDEEVSEFESILQIAYSPFDEIDNILLENLGMEYHRFGIKKFDVFVKKDYSLLDELSKEFLGFFMNCMSNKTKRDNWNEIIKILESDPLFSSYNLGDYVFNDNIYTQNEKNMKELFFELSSGHKVVLATVTCCIDKLAEKTILFIDEPENHLHPPLVASLIRTISVLLIKRNAVAIIATHSPIVLQEVPKSCVWILNRTNDIIKCKRPKIETFGANIGSLTNEVFGYEVKKSGFHNLLREVVLHSESYKEVLEKFNHQLGDEAKSLVRILLSQKGV